MIEQITTWLNLVLSALWHLSPPFEVAVGGTAVVAIVLVSACVAFAALLVVTRPQHAPARAPHPRRAIDVSTPLAQSDPDAPGHPRPRAPQRVSAA